jgi:potassium-dependent mechanosensitive channel
VVGPAPMRALSGQPAVLFLAAALSWLLLAGAASAQLTLPGFAPREEPKSPPAGAASEASGGAIPTVAIFDRALEVDATLRGARKVLGGAEFDRITGALPQFREDMAELSRISDATLATSRQRDLHDLMLMWDGLRDRLKAWRLFLKQRTQAMEAQQSQIAALHKTWAATRTALSGDAATPRMALEKTQQVIAALDATEQLLSSSAGRLFTLQERMSGADEAIALNLERTRNAAEADGNRLLRRTGFPIWEVTRRFFSVQGGLPPLRAHGEHLARGMRAFWHEYGGRLPLDACGLLAFLTAALLLARRARKQALAAGHAPSAILGTSLSGASLIAVVVARLLYPRSMFAVLDLFGLISLVPLFRLIPALVRHHELVAPIGTLIGVLALHRCVPLLHFESPWYELALLFVGALLWVAAYWTVRRRALLPEASFASRLDRALVLFFRVTLVGLAAALLAGLLGYYALLAFLIDGLAASAYWLLLSLAFTRVLLAFIDAALDWSRMRALASVRDHDDLIRSRAVTAASFSGVVLWLSVTLYAFGLLMPALDWASLLFGTTAHFGAWTLSLGGVARFGLTMYVASKAASLISFILEQDVLPRLALARGLPPTISRLSRYAVLALGFLFAVGAAGVDMSHVAMLASALSVGIGFGLQNVVNNFVSGLILIFERPIRVGDMVQLGQLVGEVRKIGIRASTLRTFQGAEVILPNANLIANEVINWTLSDLKRRIEIPIGVAYGTDPQAVIALIKDAVKEIDAVERYPAPVCIFTAFGQSSLDFELRLWVQRSDDWPNARSAVLVAVYAALTQAGIEIPFPQQDLHVRSVDEALAEQLLRAPGSERAPEQQGRADEARESGREPNSDAARAELTPPDGT